jgi:hypothetical protein
MIHRRRASVMLLTLIASVATVSARATVMIDWFTIDGGGAMRTAAGALELSGTIGQPDAHQSLTMSGATFTLTGGFWPGVQSGLAPPGDCNADGRVTIEDYSVFGPCLTGPGVVIDPDCECADLDGDFDADLVDFAVFQRAYGAP